MLARYLRSFRYLMYICYEYKMIPLLHNLALLNMLVVKTNLFVEYVGSIQGSDY
jgi:hypothetical protein